MFIIEYCQFQLKKMKLLVCLLWCAVWWTSPARCLKKRHNIGLGEPDTFETSNSTVEDKFFVQNVDHFNPADGRTWAQVLR